MNIRSIEINVGDGQNIFLDGKYIKDCKVDIIADKDDKKAANSRTINFSSKATYVNPRILERLTDEKLNWRQKLRIHLRNL